MTTQREMTLDEWVGQLAPSHAARAEYSTLRFQWDVLRSLHDTDQETIRTLRARLAKVEPVVEAAEAWRDAHFVSWSRQRYVLSDAIAVLRAAEEVTS